jgi:hypothetical protein
LALLLPVLLLVPNASHAQDTVLSNIGEPAFGYVIGSGYQSFRTGAGADGYLLNSVTLVMGGWAGYATNFTVGIYSDAGGHPGGSLGALSGSNDPEGGGQYAYVATGLILNPATTYWISENFDLNGAPPPPQPPAGGYSWQFTASTIYDSGGGWQLNPAGNSIGNGFSFQMALNASAIPEPCPLAIVLLGFSAVLLYRKE